MQKEETEMLSYKRDHYCGLITREMAGETVHLSGWVQRTRDLGGLVFVWLRDREGLVQLVFDGTDCSPELLALAQSLRSEYVLTVSGEVRLRDEAAINRDLKTGEVEIVVRDAVLLNKSETPPIYIDDKADENELVRLKYRYLDLRRPSMYEKLRIRSRVVTCIRNALDEQGFNEVETPILSKSTPEGARDFLVPSRLHPGTFYALPQSPQIYKQLLMLAGFDKYYQIARCFRDEDNRADRQPEFTQCDIEMSFIDEEDIYAVVEKVYAKIFKEIKGVELQLPLPRMTWHEAMENYGSDKPDTRFEMKLVNISDAVRNSGFVVFDSAIENGGRVCAINAKGLAGMTRKEIDSFGEFVKTYRAKGLPYMTFTADGNVKSSFNKHMTPELVEAVRNAMHAEPGDIIFFGADKKNVVWQSLGALRCEIARRHGLIDHNKYNLFWVTEFPLAGVRFQRKWERAAFIAGGSNYHAPAQLVGDFLRGAPSKAAGSVRPTYRPGVAYTALDDCLPDYVLADMRAALPMFDRKIHGFADANAVLTGVETRSSSPVRILRGADCASASARGLYPCGEGAGYAGGILSAAVDGLRCAEALIENGENT